MTPEEHTRRLLELANSMPTIVNACLFAGANQFEGMLEKRVFTLGKDENGNPIGKYSPAYAEFRRDRGYQAGYVDLLFKGNLQKSIQTKKVQGGWAVVFNNPKQAKIARKNEVRFKGSEETIFDISAEEKKVAIEAQDKEYKARVRRIMEGIA